MSPFISPMPKRLRRNQLFSDQAFINDVWIGAEMIGRAGFAVLDPATGECLAHVPDLSVADARLAIRAAHDAFPGWRDLTARSRSLVMRRWFDLITENLEDLALILTFEQGKSLAEARAEISYGASFVEWFAEEAKRVYGDVIPAPLANQKIVILKQPIGVVAAITPWNFPVAMITRKIAPALAAGCTVVVKPSDETPLSALALARLAQEAGFPKGVVNVITTRNAEGVGRELSENPMIRKVSFTGSTQVGKILMKQSSSTMKKLSLELGGNAPFVVFEDADLDLAIEGAIASKFRNSGQTCVCTNRFFIHEKIYEQFANRLAGAARQLKLGHGVEPGVQQGPLINLAAVAKVENHIQDALDKGAKLLCGGQRSQRGDLFFEPTVLTEATVQMKFAQEETFGPLAALIRFESEDEVINWCNETEVGLAAYFYSRDVARVWRVAGALEVGMIGINEGLISNEVAPFGGVKESGQGREGSKYGILDYVETKYLMFGHLESK